MTDRDRSLENASTGLFDFGMPMPFPNGIEVWLRFQSNLLSSMQSTMMEWMERQQSAITMVQTTLAKIQECRDPSELLEIQQKFVASCAEHAGAEAGAFGETLRRLTNETAAEFDEARRRFAVMQWRDPGAGAASAKDTARSTANLRLIRTR